MQFHWGGVSVGRQFACGKRWQRVIGVSLLCIPALVAAQSSSNSTSASTAPPAGDSRASNAKPATTMGEIIVTANRRREPSREVPMHVDTVKAADLQKVGARTLSDYVAYQPGVFFASSGGAGQGELIMRGVSTGNQTSPTVSVYMDDVPVGGSTVYASAATFVFDAADRKSVV